MMRKSIVQVFSWQDAERKDQHHDQPKQECYRLLFNHFHPKCKKCNSIAKMFLQIDHHFKGCLAF